MNALKLTYARHQRGKIAPPFSDQLIRYCELTVLLKGELLYTVDHTPIHLQPGDVIFLPSGTLRSRARPDEPCDYISFNFITEEPPSLPHYIKGGADGDVRLFLAAFDAIGADTYGEDSEVTEHLLAALLLLLEQRVQSARIHVLTRRILDYIHENLSQRISLEQIGRACFFSPVYCDTVFKRDMGCSIIDYTLMRRISLAKKMLAEGSRTLVQIAERVGFEDYNYFSRVFKKRTGYSPSQYKKLFFFN